MKNMKEKLEKSKLGEVERLDYDCGNSYIIGKSIEGEGIYYIERWDDEWVALFDRQVYDILYESNIKKMLSPNRVLSGIDEILEILKVIKDYEENKIFL